MLELRHVRGIGQHVREVVVSCTERCQLAPRLRTCSSVNPPCSLASFQPSVVSRERDLAVGQGSVGSTGPNTVPSATLARGDKGLCPVALRAQSGARPITESSTGHGVLEVLGRAVAPVWRHSFSIHSLVHSTDAWQGHRKRRQVLPKKDQL